MKKKKITIIGGGAWGTALAIHIIRSGLSVEWIIRNSTLKDHINKFCENNKYLPGISLPPHLHATTSKKAINNSNLIFLAVPSQYLRSTLIQFSDYWPEQIPAIICCKGIENKTGALMSEVVQEVISDIPITVLSGPTFAHEVAQGLPIALTLACSQRNIGKNIIKLIGTPAFRPYLSTDIIGVEIAGALKNVLAIASGIITALKFGDSAKAALITRGLVEISRLIVAMGGQSKTIMGLSGVGDLILTCTGSLSRNYTFGLALGQGYKTYDIICNRKVVTEGVDTAASITLMAKKYNIDMPLCTAIDQVVNHGANLDYTINELMQRPFRDEIIIS